MTVLQESDDKRGFRWPADYYSSPSPKAVLPQWLTYGCGAAGVFALLVIFVGGALLSRGGFTEFMDFAIGMSVGEMRGMYAPDVSAERKKSLDAEIARMRENYRQERVAMQALQPFLLSMQDAISDNRVTGAEAARLEAAARKINARAQKR
ncbi:MAG TPA: hypothetical protein VEK57_11740 [Thermoanaerobaculia bacterium]|nr:hypothetical protein [Thermoanaerobaculia bacterium]